MRSNPAHCGMCRDVEPKRLDEQAFGHAFERSRQTGFRAGRAQVTGLVRPRTRQAPAAVGATPAQPRGGQVAAPQYRDRVTWQRWVKEGMEALSDKPRSGAPRKLDEAAIERLLQWARQEPLSAIELLQRHIEAQGSPVEVNTMIRARKANGMVWKCTRHSLKKTRRRRLRQVQPSARQAEGSSAGGRDRTGLPRRSGLRASSPQPQRLDATRRATPY